MPEDAQEIFALRSSDEINKYLDRPKANTLDDAQSFITKIINGIA
jgi:ribosomal-protein-alanine N-acetyltransferase